MPDTAPVAVDQRSVLRDFQRIPSVGKRVALDLWSLGLRNVAELAERDPEELYARLCQQTGSQVDRCMLYTFRCAVYFASTDLPDPELLKWWNWTDERLAERSRAGDTR